MKPKTLILMIGVLVVVLCSVPAWWLWRTLFPPCGQLQKDPNIEVIVSDCNKPILLSTSPDGKYMFYADTRAYWMRNLITGEETKSLVAPRYWLTSTLALQESRGVDRQSFLVYDVTDGSQTPLQWVYERENFSSVLPVLQRGGEAYYESTFGEMAIVLAPDFKNHPQDNYALTLPLKGYIGDRKDVLRFLQDNHISFTRFSYWHNYDDPLPSHDGRLLAKGSEIVDLNGKRVVIAIGAPITGWAHDDSGVYLQDALTGGPASVLMPLLMLPKDQPILKLKVPIQYLSPEARAKEEARLAQQQREEQNRTVLLWVGVIVAILVAIGTTGFFLARKRRQER